MITALLHVLRLCPFLLGGHRQLALENLASEVTLVRRARESVTENRTMTTGRA